MRRYEGTKSLMAYCEIFKSWLFILKATLTMNFKQGSDILRLKHKKVNCDYGMRPGTWLILWSGYLDLRYVDKSGAYCNRNLGKALHTSKLKL